MHCKSLQTPFSGKVCLAPLVIGLVTDLKDQAR